MGSDQPSQKSSDGDYELQLEDIVGLAIMLIRQL